MPCHATAARLASLLLLASFTAGRAAATPIVLNPSLSGPMAASVSPPDWFAWQGTPDTCDPSGPFNDTGTRWNLSPDGVAIRGGAIPESTSAVPVATPLALAGAVRRCAEL